MERQREPPNGEKTVSHSGIKRTNMGNTIGTRATFQFESIFRVGVVQQRASPWGHDSGVGKEWVSHLGNADKGIGRAARTSACFGDG